MSNAIEITWSVPGCIYSSRSGKPMEPVFERRTEAERLTLWHVLETYGERHHNLFPNEETARVYAATIFDCQVYPHDANAERRRVSAKSNLQHSVENLNRLTRERENAKRGRGRPAGSRNAQTLPDEARRKGHEITLTDAAWDKAQATGNASGYIEGLILKDAAS